MRYPEEISKKLNELLEKNFDSEKGFRNAAEDVNNSRLKSFFEHKAQERYDFCHELRSEIRDFGQTPENRSTVKGDAMRSWMNLKVFLSKNKEEAVLEEVIRGEKAAIDDYNKVLKQAEFPPSTQNMLIKQRNAILKTLEDVESFEEYFS